MRDPVSSQNLVLVTGCRALNQGKAVRQALWSQMLRDFRQLPDETLVIHGGAEGPDTFAQEMVSREIDAYRRRPWRGLAPKPFPFVRYEKGGLKVASKPEWRQRLECEVSVDGERGKWLMGPLTPNAPFERNERMIWRAQWALQNKWRVWVLGYFAPWADNVGTRHCYGLAEHLIFDNPLVTHRQWWCPAELGPASHAKGDKEVHHLTDPT